MDYLNIVGVQFIKAGKIYDFDARDHYLRIGDNVIVETDRGQSMARVVRLKYVESEQFKGNALKPVLNKASKRPAPETGRITEDSALAYAKERVATLGLEMKPLKADVQFGGNKIIIYFSSPGRVDFRELVKDLAGGLKARVELKQVGARDETKLMGGIGVCGREYCCSSFLREFVPVSIKMAKNQNLVLNPTKVSGGCGRLLCCLTYENDLYVELRKKLPPRGSRVKFGEEQYGDVIKADFLNQLIVVELEDGKQMSVPVAEAQVVDRKAGTSDDSWAEGLNLEALTGEGGELDTLDDDTGSPRPPKSRDSAPREPGQRDNRPPRQERAGGAPRGDRGGRGRRGGRGGGGGGGGSGGSGGGQNRPPQGPRPDKPKPN